MLRVSLVMLTFNRPEFLAQTMAHNMANAGAALHELIWVDNGSSDTNVHDIMRAYNPDVSILNKQNLGVSKGYNRGFAVATGDYIVITDSDMLMPDGWLGTFMAYLIAIPHTGVACMFHHEIKDKTRQTASFNGLSYHPCIPWGKRIVSRRLLQRRIGYLCEDLGLYGLEDIEWANRALRVCRHEGLICYSIPDRYGIHLGTHQADDPKYRAFKEIEVHDPKQREVMARCEEYNYPYINPFA